MERAIITISENGSVHIPSGNVWMSEMELVELFGVIAPTLRAAIKARYKSGTLCSVTTQRCDLTTLKSWATYYNLEVVIALAFRLNTYEASRVRQKVLEGLYQRKEEVRCFYWLHYLSINYNTYKPDNFCMMIVYSILSTNMCVCGKSVSTFLV